MDTILHCGNLPEDVQKLCCTSCHEDADEGYYPLATCYEDWHGYNAEFCCSVSIWADAHKEQVIALWENKKREANSEKEKDKL